MVSTEDLVLVVKRSKSSTDRHVIDSCQVEYSSQAKSGFETQTGNTMVWISSGPDESQGCLCPVERSTGMTDKCSPGFLQHLTTKKAVDPCPGDAVEYLVINLHSSSPVNCRRPESEPANFASAWKSKQPRCKEYWKGPIKLLRKSTASV